MTYSSARFRLSVIFKFGSVGVFVESGFFSGCLAAVEAESAAAAATSAVEKENVGDMEENGNALKVGDGVSRVKAVNEGDVPRNTGVLGLDGVPTAAPNRAELGGSVRLASLVLGCPVPTGSGSSSLAFTGSSSNLTLCAFLMMQRIAAGIDRHLSMKQENNSSFKTKQHVEHSFKLFLHKQGK